jgi:uncharacterized protein YvpB
MRGSAFAAWIIALAFLLALAGCQPAAGTTTAAGIPSRNAAGSALRSATLAIKIPSPIRTPLSPPTESPVAESTTPTPTLCLPGGPLGIDGRAMATPTLPAKASIGAIRGRTQSLPLDCESRSAVDWAGYFGTAINELEFFNKLPGSDNPDQGFVGNVRGQWGNLPPNAYGVYAGPVAKLLRVYGVEAYAYRGLGWDQLRAEIAAGRPVIVWVVGHIWKSVPVTLTVASGDTILAARLEHTVILIGYTETMATVLDGAMKYSVPQPAFMTSWGTLGNMAIVGRMIPARPDCAGAAVELIPGNS